MMQLLQSVIVVKLRVSGMPRFKSGGSPVTVENRRSLGPHKRMTSGPCLTIVANPGGYTEKIPPSGFLVGTGSTPLATFGFERRMAMIIELPERDDFRVVWQ